MIGSSSGHENLGVRPQDFAVALASVFAETESVLSHANCPLLPMLPRPLLWLVFSLTFTFVRYNCRDLLPSLSFSPSLSPED